MSAARTEIAVIGAGVIGLTIALRLARAGREVVLIDPATPGSGASWGNAGTIADYAVLPVGTPSVLRNLPALLLDRNSPLAIRRAALPALAPWLMRFLRQSLPAAARRNAKALAALNADAAALWLSLAAEIGGEDLLNHNGCLYLYESQKDRTAAEADMAYRRGLGVTVDLVSADRLAQMEPGLPPIAGGGAFFPQAIFLSDPGEMVARLARAAQAAGARHISARVTGLARTPDGARLSGPGLALDARHAIIAAGAHSRMLARQAGDRIPLDTERGYHVEYDMAAPVLSRPASPSSRGFYMCPMTGRLRVAGTVELGGLHAPPSPHRIARLDQGVRALFPDLPAPSRDWMGFRPSMPDSLPVIGPSRNGAEILHAYGHGHIGLTLAPTTARLIEAALAGRTPDEMTPCLPTRFP